MEGTSHDRYRVVIAADGDEDAQSIAKEIERQGAEEIDVKHDGAGFFPIPVFAALVIGWMSITGFLAWLHNWVKTRQRSGLLLRVTEAGELSVQKIDIPFGQVVLVTKDGQWLVYDTDREKLSDLVTKLASGIAPAGGTPTSAAEVGAAG